MNKKNQVIANEIADKLGEAERKPRRQIQNLVNRCGVEFAQQLLQETLEIEAGGGMLIANGERRRTPGGVYFHLARERVSEEVRDEIFYSWRTAIRRRQVYEATFPEFSWENRAELVQKLLQNKGEVSEVNIQLKGRPGEIERRQHLVVTTMQQQFDENIVLPAGVPELPKEPLTYTVYISSRQWERVEAAIQKPDDDLIVEGYCAYDPETETLGVYTTFVTTRKLKRKDKKQSKRDAAEQNKGGSRAHKSAGRADTRDRTDRHYSNGDMSEPAPPPVVVDIDIPPGVPPEVAQKLTDLHQAAASFRQKISALEEKPANQQFGLEMTQKLLRNTEQQIEKLTQKYIKS